MFTAHMPQTCIIKCNYRFRAARYFLSLLTKSRETNPESSYLFDVRFIFRVEQWHIVVKRRRRKKSHFFFNQPPSLKFPPLCMYTSKNSSSDRKTLFFLFQTPLLTTFTHWECVLYKYYRAFVSVLSNIRNTAANILQRMKEHETARESGFSCLQSTE